jgi:RecJ-like exonuclease|tara:strand:- start:50 stop:292 length:243 start_codon:yes stop_codon:yes gene_type:complete
MKDKIMKCPECKGTGYIEWGVSYDEIQECEVCEGHGEWLTDDEELELSLYTPMTENEINIMAEDSTVFNAIQERNNYESL